MRKIAPAFFVLATFASGIGTPAHAAIEYPWCAQYGRDDGRNCGFSTYEQCMATVSGTGGFCERNSFYTGPAEQPARRPHKRRHYD